MKITVLWEDQRGGAIKGFGPHELLVACVADALQCERHCVTKYVQSIPRKGNGNVIRALKQDLSKLSRSGPVCAVLDSDQVLNLWPGGQRPATCRSGIRAAVSAKASGDYKLILLDKNVETVVEACCRAMGDVTPVSKPLPDDRDRLLGRAAWSAVNVRDNIRLKVQSFNYLVQWVVENMPGTVPGSSQII